MITTVKVYRNLHNGKLSVKQNLVIGHCDQITLKNAKFKLSKKGIQRIRTLKRKEVCAVVEGLPIDFKNYRPFRNRYLHHIYMPIDFSASSQVYFNPYINRSFVNSQNNSIASADYVSIAKDGTILVIGEKYDYS